MRLAAQADFYIEKFGIEKSVSYLKNLGYQDIIYTMATRDFEGISSDNSESVNVDKYDYLRKVLDDSGMNLIFTVVKEEIYNDQMPQLLERRKKTYIQAVHATANLGCKYMGVRPVCLRCSTPGAWEESRKLTYEIYSEIKEEADKVGVKLAFFNNTKQLCFSSGTYSYGCKASELLELAEYFDAGIIVNPVYALKAGERVEELLLVVQDKLLGFCIDDKSQRANAQGIPMFGAVDYYGLTEFFRTYRSEAAGVMMYTPILNRYSDFLHDFELVDAITKAFMSVAQLITGCNAQKNEKEILL